MSDGTRIIYAHMEHASNPPVKEGDTVRPGTPIGGVGNTGNSYGNHLHVEVRGSDGRNIDPSTLMPGLR